MDAKNRLLVLYAELGKFKKREAASLHCTILFSLARGRQHATSLTENPGKVNKGDHEKENPRYLEDSYKIGMIPNMKVRVFVVVAHDYIGSLLLLFNKQRGSELCRLIDWDLYCG
jgi:hypothetical protein